MVENKFGEVSNFTEKNRNLDIMNAISRRTLRSILVIATYDLR
jgi:hypothetical protein